MNKLDPKDFKPSVELRRRYSISIKQMERFRNAQKIPVMKLGHRTVLWHEPTLKQILSRLIVTGPHR